MAGNNGNENIYVGAPYNFVPLYNKVYEAYENFDELPLHDRMLNDRHSGEINVCITAKTPVSIGDAEGVDFFKSQSGEYAIPGSSFRGLVRSNMQILGCGAVGEDIEDELHMYRMVGAKKSDLKTTYEEILGIKPVTMPGSKNPVSVPQNVKAGYISCEKGKYYIYGTDVDVIDYKLGETNYYIVREPDIDGQGADGAFSALYAGGDKSIKLRKTEYRYDKSGKKPEWKGKNNRSFRPYYEPVSYNLEGSRKITSVKESDVLSKNGYAMVSGAMNGTLAVYIIPDVDEKKLVAEISDRDVLAYKTDYERKERLLGTTDNTGNKNLAENTKNFFKLPKEGEKRPVFYINYDQKLYFGYSPFIRLFYGKSVYDGVQKIHKDNEIIDYPRSMFGFHNNDAGTAYKSRLYFEDMKIASDKEGGKAYKSEPVILGTPKTSSYMDYIEDGKDFNADKFKIRGIKQYWLHDKVCKVTADKENVSDVLSVLPEKTQFRGKIEFKNLTDEELGLLIWSIRCNEDSDQNIGKGKPLGYGRIKVNIESIKELTAENAYNLDNDAIQVDPYKDISESSDVFIEAYKKNMNVWLNKKKNKDNEGDDVEIDDIESVRTFMQMKSEKYVPAADLIRYMSLPEYTKRSSRLMDVSELIGNKVKEEEERKKEAENEALSEDELLVKKMEELMAAKGSKYSNSRNNNRNSRKRKK